MDSLLILLRNNSTSLGCEKPVTSHRSQITDSEIQISCLLRVRVPNKLFTEDAICLFVYLSSCLQFNNSVKEGFSLCAELKCVNCCVGTLRAIYGLGSAIYRHTQRAGHRQRRINANASGKKIIANPGRPWAQ